MNTKIILGAPGTGKTTRLLSIMDNEMSNGVNPHNIAFVSFTRKAANEATERAMTKFGLEQKDLPYFRTLHSMCMRWMGHTSADLMKSADWKAVGALMGLEFTGTYASEEGLPAGSRDGDKMLFLESLSRVKKISPRELYTTEDWGFSWYAFEQFQHALVQYKADKCLLDFTDLLEMFVNQNEAIPVEVAIIDEAQDLSKLQWEVVRTAFKNTRQIYIAGDDDQAIYTWAGADVNEFLTLKGDYETLGKSHRLPRKVFDFANNIANRISRRFKKKWEPRDEDGTVDFHTSLDSIHVDEKSWMFLARNKYLLQPVELMLRSTGIAYTTATRNTIDNKSVRAIRAWESLRKGNSVPAIQVKYVYEMMTSKEIKRGFKNLKTLDTERSYSLDDLKKDYGLLVDDIWHRVLTRISASDRTYYEAILRRGGSLVNDPKVHISTIHGTKGGEADNVVLMADMSYRTFQGFQNNPDDEHRVFYVGATRAKHHLHIIRPQGRIGYPLG
jgi:DNA helicase II / ATP-dependent DNA helicase PcrA